ncbi:MAG: hypothetical protein H7Y08_07545 [Rhizobiaceae bacterium]|nr:hypothetical protein [Rhizobiaceae bacterium]
MITTDVNLIPRSFYDAQTQAVTVSKPLADSVQTGIQAKLDTLPPVARGEFLSQVANLAPGDLDTPAELTATLNRLETAARSVDAMTSTVTAFVGDIAKFLGRAMIEFATQQRQNALDERMAARDAAKAQLMDQATQMDAAAAKMESGALANAILGGISAAVSGISAGMSVFKQGAEIKSMTSAAADTKASNKAMATVNESGFDAPQLKSEISGSLKNADVSFNLAQSRSQQAMTSAQIGEAVGTGFRIAGTATDSMMQAGAKTADAEGARDAAEATYQQQVGDQKKEIQQAMDEMIKQLINFLKEMQEAEVDAMRALTKV